MVFPPSRPIIAPLSTHPAANGSENRMPAQRLPLRPLSPHYGHSENGTLRTRPEAPPARASGPRPRRAPPPRGRQTAMAAGGLSDSGRTGGRKLMTQPPAKSLTRTYELSDRPSWRRGANSRRESRPASRGWPDTSIVGPASLTACAGPPLVWPPGERARRCRPGWPALARH